MVHFHKIVESLDIVSDGNENSALSLSKSLRPADMTAVHEDNASPSLFLATHPCRPTTKLGLYIPGSASNILTCYALIGEASSNDHEQIAWRQQKNMCGDQQGTWHKRRKTTPQEQRVKNAAVPGV